MKALMRQGEWQTNKGLAQCVELEGFGIVGAVIDTEGESIILRRALACAELVAAFEAAVERMETVSQRIGVENRHKGISQRAHVAHMAGHLEQHAKIARAALAKAKGE